MRYPIDPMSTPIVLKCAPIVFLLCMGGVAIANRSVVTAAVQAPILAATIAGMTSTARTMPAPEAVELRSPSKRELDQYVISAMRSWSPAVKQIATVDYDTLASAIVDAVNAHEPAWKNDTTGARSAILLASLAYYEGARYARYVADGRCNDKRWRKSPEGIRLMRIGGNCDSGRSYSLWQIHSLGGTLDGTRIDPSNLIGDLEFSASVALMKARSSLRMGAGLCYYVGERPWRGCPRAQKRLNLATAYWHLHPFSPTSLDAHSPAGIE